MDDEDFVVNLDPGSNRGILGKGKVVKIEIF